MKKKVPESPVVEYTPKKTKKCRLTRYLLLFIFILAVAAGAAYYFYEKQQPEKIVEEFLGYVQNMNYNGMSSLLQSNDLSALDEAYIRNAAYSEFLEKMNQKMTFKIVRNRFSIQNGTASVTVRIKHINASKIYEDAFNEYVRQIASMAFSGASVQNTELQQQFADILNKKSQNLPDVFVETDIVYPLIQVNNEWKIVALNEETVKIMSSDLQALKKQLDQSFTEQQSNASESPSQMVSSAESGSIDMTNEHFTIHYTLHRISKDFGGHPCVLVYYDYTNNGNAPSSAMVNVKLKACQNGKLLEATIASENDAAIDQYMSEVAPGKTVNVCQVFLLKDDSDITLEASDAFALKGGTVSQQILKVK